MHPLHPPEVGYEHKNYDQSRTYTVAINDFLLTGNEQGLDYLTPDNPGLTVLAENEDIRRATINQLKATFPPQ